MPLCLLQVLRATANEHSVAVQAAVHAACACGSHLIHFWHVERLRNHSHEWFAALPNITGLL